MSTSSDFTWVEGSEPHRQRTREIIKKHPEVKWEGCQWTMWSLLVFFIFCLARRRWHACIFPHMQVGRLYFDQGFP